MLLFLCEWATDFAKAKQIKKLFQTQTKKWGDNKTKQILSFIYYHLTMNIQNQMLTIIRWHRHTQSQSTKT